MNQRFDFGLAYVLAVGVFLLCFATLLVMVLVGALLTAGEVDDFRVFLLAPPCAVLGLYEIHIVRQLRAKRRHQSGRCIKCAYDLTGNVSGVCPECGVAIAWSADQLRASGMRSRVIRAAVTWGLAALAVVLLLATAASFGAPIGIVRTDQWYAASSVFPPGWPPIVGQARERAVVVDHGALYLYKRATGNMWSGPCVSHSSGYESAGLGWDGRLDATFGGFSFDPGRGESSGGHWVVVQEASCPSLLVVAIAAIAPWRAMRRWRIARHRRDAPRR